MRHLKFSLFLLACSLFFNSSVFAVGFGDPLLRSYLGQPLRVQVPVTGVSQDDLSTSCLEATVNTIEGHFISHPRMEFVYPKHVAHEHESSAPAQINLFTKETISEPAITLSITLKCGHSMQRTYSLLLDFADISTPPAVVVSSDAEPAMTSAAPTKHAMVASSESLDGADKDQVATVTKTPKKANVAKKATGDASKSAVKPKVAINAKLDDKRSQPKDQLKITNQEVLINPDNPETKSAPLSASLIDNKQPVDIELQRLQENSLAEERFSAMLKNEPGLLAAQSVGEKNEQQKIDRLESELERLKKQLHVQVQSSMQPQEHHLPTSLVVMNVVGIVLLLVLICVVGILWISLQKMRQQQGNHWWNAQVDNKRHAKEEPELKQKADAMPTSFKEEKFDVTPTESAKPEHVVDTAQSGAFNMFTSRSGQSIQIEEVSDSTQEAEFWVSINNPQRAIEILEPQSQDENLSMPVTLIYLLDLYRLVGDEAKYTKLSQRLKSKLNICIPKFGEEVEPAKQKHLEDYEHVTSRCCAFWNTNYILPYLESLLIDDREGERIGFDISVYRDILFLITLCKELDRTKDVSAAST